MFLRRLNILNRHMSTSSSNFTVAVICPPENQAIISNLNQNRTDGVRFVIGNDLKSFDSDIDSIQALMFVAVGGSLSLLPTLYEACGNNIKWVHSLFAGVDALEPFITSHLKPDGVLLTNGRGAFSSSLAEYVLASALHFNKNISTIQQNQRNKKWDKFIMPTLKGKTMGFVGFGDIGKTSAILAKQFGMKIIALRRNPNKKDNTIADEVIGPANKMRLFAESDFVVSVLPGTPETKNYCGAAEFAAMKTTGIFISVGRGLVVDENALVDAIIQGEIAGAALDVFKTEPLPIDSKLWELDDKILLTAHNADYTEDYWKSGIHIFEENLSAFCQGGTTDSDMTTPVDKESGY